MIILRTHREQLKERILENLPLLVLVCNHWNVDFAEVLGEQEDQTDCAVGKHKTGQNVSLSYFPEDSASLIAISIIVLKQGMLPYNAIQFYL